MIAKFIASKKVRITLIAFIAAVLSVAIGKDIDPDLLNKLIVSITTIAASFNIGQGVADGMSKGQTSSAGGRGRELSEMLDVLKRASKGQGG